MRYRVVTTSGVKNYENKLALMEDWRTQFTGYHTSPRTRIELQDQPQFRTLIGPMWGGMLDEKGDYVFDGGGEPCVRYEDSETYRQLST